MISKKKVTALALAGLFVTPVLADTYVPNNNSIQSGDGYLTADDDLFSQALKNSRNRTDSSKDAVKLSMWGVSGFLCLGRLFQGQPNEAALCI